ncbi:MAG: hypothetical protein ACREXR_03430, partial [Gammaproteobacteria bacterium]
NSAYIRMMATSPGKKQTESRDGSADRLDLDLILKRLWDSSVQLSPRGNGGMRGTSSAGRPPARPRLRVWRIH